MSPDLSTPTSAALLLAAHEADLVACAEGLGVTSAALGAAARELGA